MNAIALRIHGLRMVVPHLATHIAAITSIHPPSYRWKLIKARVSNWLFQRFTPFRTPCGFPIEHRQQLISWWDHGVVGQLFQPVWTNRMPEFPVIIDIGANCGAFGWACRQRWPYAIIIAIEPQPRFANDCRRLGCYNAVHEIALSNKPGVSTFYLPDCGSDTGSLLPHSSNCPDRETISVRTERLDNMPLPIADLIKCDVDGAELKVIAGGQRFIESCRFFESECLSPERATTIGAMLHRDVIPLPGVEFLFPRLP